MKTVFRFEDGLYKKISVEDQLKARISQLEQENQSLNDTIEDLQNELDEMRNR